MRFNLILPVLLLVAGPALSQPMQPDAVTSKYGERRAYFQDWLAACRPNGYCSALSYVGARGDFADYWLRVEQPAAEGAYGVLYTPIAVIPQAEPTLTVTVDGREIAVLEPGASDGLTRGPEDAANEYRFAAQRVRDAILPAMKAGRFVDIAFTQADGKPNVQRFSLRGLTAALAWISRNRMQP